MISLIVYSVTEYVCPLYSFSLINGKTDRTLSCVVRDRISYQSNLTFSCDLFHDLCFSNSWRSHQKDRTLSDGWYFIFSIIILCKISFNGSLISCFALLIFMFFFSFIKIFGIDDQFNCPWRYIHIFVFFLHKNKCCLIWVGFFFG